MNKEILKNENGYMSEQEKSGEISIAKLVIVLVLVSAVAALALALVYQTTKDPIAEQDRLARLEAINAVLPEHDNQPDQDTKTIVIGKDRRGNDLAVTFYRATKQGNPVGTAFNMAQRGFGGDVNVMVGIDAAQKITGIKIVEHKETPGLGAKITDEAFLQQFIGKSLAGKIAIKKDGGEIDQITGASISSRAVVKAVEKGLKLYQENFGNGR
ncbi:MAG: RnfABCDGE type electron transport complex subunit G [Candidatus Schekmanbacteria bacterium]|nr:RnfABCDGE type electron transport complex subunit G [Candidatus Schekmanbacteria bacterium]